MQKKLLYTAVVFLAVITSMNCIHAKKSSTAKADPFNEVKANFKNPGTSTGVKLLVVVAQWQCQ
jgi:hypothetical protein